MTLAELIDMQRKNLEDESVGIRRSWEETFRYTLKYVSPDIPLEDFDLDNLTARMTIGGIQKQFIDGYVTRWRVLLERARVPPDENG